MRIGFLEFSLGVIDLQARARHDFVTDFVSRTRHELNVRCGTRILFAARSVFWHPHHRAGREKEGKEKGRRKKRGKGKEKKKKREFFVSTNRANRKSS